ncbi:hypothetical protein [Jannaschia seohaensis]|uniref:Uncharacterized protein n=1 Tax=Jannaschia seohaensis TaxID=475081 RepID=A0A2Y9B024_9RHOB|nr:hypothetical protein [Jannaschia seohaensis]PWJ16571.1 hypothetical protein BCF38_10885 [Jannaschia seohaensis]SSA48808.1 hypothetical protein SAMN05421539_10885 [Jannaschia seohaensis]
MFAQPVTDTLVLAIEDVPPDEWRFHYISYEPTEHHSFDTPNGGDVISAAVNPENLAAWMLADGTLFAVSHELQSAIILPLPRERMPFFDVTRLDGRYFVTGAAANIWAFDMAEGAWSPITAPAPQPDLPDQGRDESDEAYARRVVMARSAHLQAHPDMYHSFKVGDDLYFVGALGRVFRLRDGALDGDWLDGGDRLFHGFAHEDEAILVGNDPGVAVYRGTLDSGFERIWQSDETALHRMAFFGGAHYVGAGLDLSYDGPCLNVLNGDELVPVVTGCEREPGHLRHLMVTGEVLWAIDLEGIFRFTKGKWTLTELEDLA